MEMRLEDGTELVHRVSRESGASSVTVFLVDAQNAVPRLRYLFNLGLSSDTNRRYAESVCGQDPFLIAGCRLAAPGRKELLLLDQYQVQATVDVEAAHAYWRFMQDAGYREAAASIQALAPGVHLVAGLMWRGPQSAAASLPALQETLEKLFGLLSVSLVQAALRRCWFAADEALPDTLTPREQNVVAALRRGLSNKQIAAALDLSEFTIENHLRRIYRKHGVRNRTSLIASLRAAARP